MSTEYELLDIKAPCAWPSPPCQQDGINDRCPTCHGDGFRRVPTGRIVREHGFSDTFREVTDDAE